MPVIVLYDGLCGFCDGAVQWLLARDRRGALRFAPLQGETAAAIRERHPEWPEDLDSIVVVWSEGAEERIAWYAAAAWRALSALDGAWALLARAGTFVPRAIADAGYRFVARHRLRVAGRRNTCRVPTPAERERFLP